MFRFLLRWRGCSVTGGRKSEHLRREEAKSSDLTAGGEVLRRGRLCKKPPPKLISLVTFLFSDKKVTDLVFLTKRKPARMFSGRAYNI